MPWREPPNNRNVGLPADTEVAERQRVTSAAARSFLSERKSAKLRTSSRVSTLTRLSRRLKSTLLLPAAAQRVTPTYESPLVSTCRNTRNQFAEKMFSTSSSE